MTIKGRLLLSVTIVKRFSAENFVHFFCQNLPFRGHKKGFNVNFNFFNPQKALPWVKTRWYTATLADVMTCAKFFVNRFRVSIL